MPLTLIYTHKDARIEVDEINSYLQITWLQHPNSKVFRHIVTLASRYAAEYQLTSWLCDMRKLYYLLLRDQNWLVQQVYAGLNSTTNYELAYVVSQEDLELYTSFRIQNLVETHPQLSKIIQIEIFFEKSLALQWLLYQY